MTLSISGNRTFFALENRTSLTYTIQVDKLPREDLLVDYSIEGNRLYQHLDGSVEIIPKTPAEVIGEWILRPLIDSSYDFSCRTFQVLRTGFSFFDGILSKTLNFLPGAKAYPLTRNPSREISTDLKDEDENEDSGFESSQAALDYIEKNYKKVRFVKVAGCPVKESIDYIKNQDFSTDENNLKKAYNDLQLSVKTGRLSFQCSQELISLLDKLDKTDTDFCSINSLYQLSQLLESFLNMPERVQSVLSANLLVRRVNGLSRKIVNTLKTMNDKTTLLYSIDVMLKSAAKDQILLIPTFQVALHVLQADVENKIGWQQKLKLRKLAKWHNLASTSKQHKEIANKILQETGSEIWLFNFILSYLESISDSLEKLDEPIQHIAFALLTSKIFRLTGILGVGGIALGYAPANTRKVLLAAFLALGLYEGIR